MICVEKIAGLNDVHPMNVEQHPGLHLLPAAGRLGRAHRSALPRRRAEMKVGQFPFIGNGKAIAMGEPEGMVKTVFDAKTGELLGAHMVGAEVTEMIRATSSPEPGEHRGRADEYHVPASTVSARPCTRRCWTPMDASSTFDCGSSAHGAQFTPSCADLIRRISAHPRVIL